MLGRIYNSGAVAVRRDYSVLPEAFVGFASTTATPREFLRYMPLNSDFRVYVIENPNGGGAAGFSTFEEMLPHTRAGLHGTVDACGVLKVTTIILNGQRAPYSKWWPQRGIIRVINVLAELVDQIESGRPYEPTKAQRLAWRTSARLPFPKPPYFHPIANVKAIDDPK